MLNCEVSLTLTWSKNCVLTDIITTDAVPAQGDNPERPAIAAPTNATFTITNCKLHVPLVFLSAEHDNILLKKLKTGFKRTIAWNKCRSAMSNQTVNNNLHYLIDPTFTNVNRLFALSFKNEKDRTSFSKYYIPKVEVKDFNALIDQRHFLKFL